MHELLIRIRGFFILKQTTNTEQRTLNNKPQTNKVTEPVEGSGT